eukprot:3243394-Amphidinium_carterae.1
MYVPGSVHLLQPSQALELRDLGFPVEWWLHAVCWRQNLSVEWTAEHVRHMSTVSASYPLAVVPEHEELQVDEPMSTETVRALDDVQVNPEEGDGSHMERRQLDEELLPELGEAEVEVPSKGQQAAILRMHTNLGHPPLATLLRAMRVAGVREGIRRWTKLNFSCPACAAWRPGPQRRPAMLPKAYDFCVVVGVDVIHVAL